MSDAKNWQDLAPDEITYLVPPRIQTMMCGVVHAVQDHRGHVTLTYTDKTTESAPCPHLQLATEESFFRVVSEVQEIARGNKPKIELAHIELG